ncbi:hypothetical protein AACH06_25530 [Ideonella sp. DXS29W]|uniref:Uncharacterized protein n=1 Tax=Ideonella lacteola TaxID=2984193 RepID=A0ABU9BZE6_9BURK
MPIAFTLAFATLITAVELEGSRADEAVALCTLAALVVGLAAHVAASFLDSSDAGDSWGVDDDLESPSTRAMDKVYWLMSWPLFPLIVPAILVREHVNAKVAARAAIDRSRRRSVSER